MPSIAHRTIRNTIGRQARRVPAAFVVPASGVTVSIVLAACASMGMAPAKVGDGALTHADGMTLYVFDRDVADGGKSVCNGPCAANWPAFTAMSTATASGDCTAITRDDGGRHWAFP